MLQISNYKKFYGNYLVLQIDDLQLDENIYWVKGDNGSGKSTFFKTLAGLLPFEGRIAVNQVDIKKQGVAYRTIVNYSEAEPLYPVFLTAHDLIQFVGKAKKANQKQSRFEFGHFVCVLLLDAN